MVYSSWWRLSVFALVSVFCACGLRPASAQTLLPGPTATTQIFDFRVTDGTWENTEQTFLDGAGVETTVFEGPEAEVIDVPTRTIADPLGTGAPDAPTFTGHMKGLSQNADGVVRGHNRVAPYAGEDFVLVTFGRRTRVRQFTRYAGADTSAENGRAGTLQFGFDLSPLDSYLSTAGESLDSLEVNFVAQWDALQDRDYELLLSYTNESEDITLADISTEVGSAEREFPGSETNWNVLFKPSRLAGEGALIGDDPRTTGTALGDYNSDDVVNLADYSVWRDSLGAEVDLPNRDPANGGVVGVDDYDSWKENFGATGGEPVIEPNTHKVVASCVRCDADEFTMGDHITTIDVLDLYNQGIREFNLVVVAAGFGDARNFAISGPPNTGANDVMDPLTFGSGVYITTSPAAAAATSAVPEPSAMVLLAVAAMGLCFARRR